MDPFVLGVLAFIGACLLAGVLFFLRGSVLFKIVTVTFFFALSISILYTFEFYKGWPTQELPYSGEVLAVSMIEGQKIYVWLVNEAAEEHWYDFFAYHDDESGRLYEITWSPEAEESWSKAAQAISKGHRVTLQPPKTKNPGESELGGTAGNGLGTIKIQSPDEILTK